MNKNNEQTLNEQTHNGQTSNGQTRDGGRASATGQIIALVLAILGFALLVRGGGRLSGLGDVGQSGHDAPVEQEDQPAPVPDQAELSRYRKEVEEVLADYDREVGAAAEAFRRRLENGRTGFAEARAAIPDAVKPYGTFKKNRKVVTAVVKDKIRNKNRVEELIRADFMGPVFEPALAGAGRMEAAYDTLLADMEKARREACGRLTVSAGKVRGLPNGKTLEKRLSARSGEVARAAAKALGTAAGAGVAVGVAGTLELAFIRSTTRAVVNICAKAAAKGTASAAAPAADGPLPIGDVIAVAGFAWTAWDIYHLTHVMPRKLRKGLADSVDSMEDATLTDVKGRAKAAINAYRAETNEMRNAAEAALGPAN